ncbi:MAG: hypothetical protein ACLRX5_10045 [Slackia sp.]
MMSPSKYPAAPCSSTTGMPPTIRSANCSMAKATEALQEAYGGCLDDASEFFGDHAGGRLGCDAAAARAAGVLFRRAHGSDIFVCERFAGAGVVNATANRGGRRVATIMAFRSLRGWNLESPLAAHPCADAKCRVKRGRCGGNLHERGGRATPKGCCSGGSVRGLPSARGKTRPMPENARWITTSRRGKATGRSHDRESDGRDGLRQEEGPFTAFVHDTSA